MRAKPDKVKDLRLMFSSGPSQKWCTLKVIPPQQQFLGQRVKQACSVCFCHGSPTACLLDLGKLRNDPKYLYELHFVCPTFCLQSLISEVTMLERSFFKGGITLKSSVQTLCCSLLKIHVHTSKHFCNNTHKISQWDGRIH